MKPEINMDLLIDTSIVRRTGGCRTGIDHNFGLERVKICIRMFTKLEKVTISMDQDQTTFRSRRMAMLIDGDNAQASLISNMLAESG